jgi:hypothetical protein
MNERNSHKERIAKDKHKGQRTEIERGKKARNKVA